MNRVLIYSEHWLDRGHPEMYLLQCVEVLLETGQYDVTIFSRSGTFDKDALSRCFKVNIGAAKVKHGGGDLATLRHTACEASGWFDIVIYTTNYRFFDSRARQTFAILQIPYGKITSLNFLSKALTGNPKEGIKDCYRLQLLRKVSETQAVLVYSRFVRDSLEEIHGVPSTVLAPSIDDFFIEGATKERVILSAGRFFRGPYNDKRYDVLVEAFKELCKRLPNTTWQYKIVGRCGTDKASQKYLDGLREAAKGFPVYFHINSSYEDLKRQYNEATLFWHAAGFGIDEKRTPQRAEHFGVSTIEAMSARCVPVAINCGGQKEIVSDGESGYLWNSVDELVTHSIRLMTDQTLLARMQSAARERFREFDREHFSRKLLSILQP